VPFIAKWSGRIAAGKIDDMTPITAVDLLPTFCEIAGVELPEGYAPDGVSQLPALLGTAGSQRAKPVFWQWRTASSRGDNWPTLAVRDGGWKLLLGKAESQVELFRFPDDRFERTNLRDEHSDEVRRLSALIDAWKETLPEELNQDCFSEKRGK
jgi:arylsulfatase A-like enzyme